MKSLIKHNWGLGLFDLDFDLGLTKNHLENFVKIFSIFQAASRGAFDVRGGGPGPVQRVPGDSGGKHPGLLETSPAL